MRGWTIGVALLITTGGAVAQVPPGTPGVEDQARRDAAARTAFEQMPDTPGTGRYPAIKLVEPTLPGHVVYRPRDLNRLGKRKLPILVWGNGGCSDDGASARHHLAQIASHGYLAIAPGRVLSGPGAIKPPPRQSGEAADTALRAETSYQQLLAGIDWAVAENERKGSPYYRRIDTAKVAVAGHSCGGLQAIQAGADPRVKTVIVHNSGVFTDGSNPIRGMKVDKSLLNKLHTPVLYVLGGRPDVAWVNGTDDFTRINHVPAALIDGPVGHGGTFRERNGGDVARFALDWLEWQLRGDSHAAKTFVGPDCRLCADAKWRFERKAL
jgi:dienelactone hydrolase